MQRMDRAGHPHTDLLKSVQWLGWERHSMATYGWGVPEKEDLEVTGKGPQKNKKPGGSLDQGHTVEVTIWIPQTPSYIVRNKGQSSCWSTRTHVILQANPN